MRRTPPLRSLGLAVLVGLPAVVVFASCGSDEAPSNASGQVSDDVTRVAVRFAESPRLSLGGIDVVGPTQFSSVTDIEVAADGSLWVLDGMAQEIRVFASDGGHRFSLGGRGDGPGEFRGLTFLGMEPDGTVMAVDQTLRRVTRYAASGGFLGTTKWRVPSLTRAIGVTGGGALVGTTEPGWPASALQDGGFYSDTVHLLVWDDPDQAPDTAALLPGFKSVTSRTGAFMLPFSRLPAAAVGDRVYVSTGPRAEIRVAGGDSLENHIRVDRPPTPVASVRSDYLAGLRETRSREDIQGIMERLEHPEVPEFTQAYSKMIVASTGHVWAARMTYDPALDGVWDVFDPDGRLLGQVRPPANFSIHSVDGELVTGAAFDDLGVPYVQQWEITWS